MASKPPPKPSPRRGEGGERKTVCNRDCPDACGIVATVEDGRVTRLTGDREHPVTKGFLCYRTSHFLATQYAPGRLTTPLLRDAHGTLAPVSWERALDFAAERLAHIRAESGPAAIFHYRSGGSLGLVTAAATELFFERFGPCTVKRGDICSGGGEAAQEVDFGVSDSSDLDDLLHARAILVWGKNVATSSPHTLPVLKEARARGAELALIDPLHQRTAGLCQRHIAVRPGGDFALAMAVGRILFERGFVDEAAQAYCDDLAGYRALCERRSVASWCAEADVAAADAAYLAELLGMRKPASILVGWGMARRQNGAAIVRSLDALALASGNVGVPGACVSYYFRRRAAFRKLWQGLSARTVCEPLFGEEVERLADPPIRAVWVTAGNPVAMLPDSERIARALRSRELVVVVDSMLTDTAELATLVLPTTTLLESDELLGAYGHHHLAAALPVVTTPGVRSDLAIMQALAARLGVELPAGDARAWKAALLDPRLGERGVTLEQLEGGAVHNPLAARVLFEGRRFATPDGRARIVTTEAPASDALARDDAYPLVLLSLSTPASQSAQWAKAPPRPNECTVHPDAAAGIGDGELGRLESRIGAITVRIRHDARQRRDVAIVPKGGHLRDGACANAITRARTTDLGEGGALYDERVRLLRLS